MNWLPNSQASVGGRALIVASVISGGLAATRSIDLGVTRLRTGFLAWIISILTFVMSAAWSPLRAIF
ncbi:MAG: hypothetical protein J07HQW2_00727 [Haloquadratum walsbyi J07HQW2]|uniref:Uncharacterized protein n=1 Tax=Haloquadratum walsbyi J07HQW2 TaxID=1238425 RepID=U1NC85_9EURY|nr:MAG: hypothetical protein J07HQW2_00727 [Haloquadratum walsbyi J07HQW2]